MKQHTNAPTVLAQHGTPAWRRSDVEIPFPQILIRLTRSYATGRMGQELPRWPMDIDSSYLRDVLDAAVSLTRADLGLIHIIDSREAWSRIVTHSGPDSSTEALVSERAWDPVTPLGRSTTTREHVFREDLAQQDPTPYVGSERTQGYRSISATPLVGRNGAVLGVLELLFREPQRPSQRVSHVVRAHARIATVLIELGRLKQEVRKRLPRAPDEVGEIELKASIRRLSTQQQNSPLRDQVISVGEQYISQLMTRLERLAVS